MKRIFRRFLLFASELLLFVAFSLVALLAAEAFLRWHYRDVLSTASGRDYFYNRSYHQFAQENNAFRLRGKHFDQQGNHALRVVVMGDSFTYGQGVYPYDKRFPEQAELLLKQQYPNLDVEFVNVGVCGCDLGCYNKGLVQFVTALHPDFVLYQWFINDMDVYPKYALFRTDALVSNKKAHQFLMEHSVVYFLAQRGWSSLNILLGRRMEYTEYLRLKFADPASKDAVLAKTMLNRLLDQLKSQNIAHGIVLFPDASTKQSEYRLGFLHEQVLNVCRERQLDCLDLRKTYSNFDSKISVLWANVLDHHPSAVAHKAAAEAIVRFFGGTWKKMAAQRSNALVGADGKKTS